MPRVGLLWRAEWDPPEAGRSIIESCKLHEMFSAFQALGVAAEPVVYSDDAVDVVKDQLLGLDGVLVWVNPIEQGLDRSKLDPVLREVVEAGVWVSAHPDVILRMATKQVLVDTREMSWGTDTKLHRTAAELRSSLLERLAEPRPLVLKQQRGMGGNGVWKVELNGPKSDGETMLRVQHAARGSVPERLSLNEFVARCEPYFAGDGSMVDQPYQARLGEGQIRVYLTHDRVVGFTHQYPRGLMPPAEASQASTSKIFELPSAPSYGDLRDRMESEWVPQLQEILNLETHALPVIWDADFLYGPRTSSGGDTYVLCEINASSTFAFPEHAMPTVAEAAIQRIQERA
ncbi:MAG TPA: Cj0069 family protein [Gaiellaceae bacterium]|nr:Cj0069 family protein [Gaiellaceae bacterium]